MNDQLDNAKTMQQDTIGDILTQHPDEPVLLADRYRVIRKLGEGGMGSVWLAEDTKLDNRQAAIKMLPSVLTANKRAIQQLKEEAKVAMQLSHPNIVTLRAFEESTEGAFLVMDYVEGQTLSDYIPDHNAFHDDDIHQIFEPIAIALDYAHSKGVVHRDIKPSNILIAGDGTVFVTDFGLAREIKESLTRVTGRNASGTLPYMSPEQLRGEPPSRAQDIYSFSATLYECLAGVPPFHRGSIDYQIVNKPANPLVLMIRDKTFKYTPSGLEKSPEARPSNCLAVVKEYLNFSITIFEHSLDRHLSIQEVRELHLATEQQQASKSESNVDQSTLKVAAPGVLSEALGIETLGGVFTELVPCGTSLPTDSTEVFSTADDNQPTVEIHLLAGNCKLAKDNRSIGRFHLNGIPPAARGVPQIEVMLCINVNGELTASAHDLDTGRIQNIAWEVDN